MFVRAARRRTCRLTIIKKVLIKKPRCFAALKAIKGLRLPKMLLHVHSVTLQSSQLKGDSGRTSERSPAFTPSPSWASADPLNAAPGGAVLHRWARPPPQKPRLCRYQRSAEPGRRDFVRLDMQMTKTQRIHKLKNIYGLINIKHFL